MKKGLPGFLSESYTGDGTQYTGTVGIPEITVSPRPRITDAASLYTLGAAYSIAPAEVEAFLKANWPTLSKLFTEHGPWEGYNVDRKETIPFQTTAHTLALILGLIGQVSENMHRYLESKGLQGRLAEFFEVGEGADLLANSPAFGWTAKGDSLDSGKDAGAFFVKGDMLSQFGIAFVPSKEVNLSGGLLRLRYQSVGEIGPVSIELKPSRPSTDDSGLIPRGITARLLDTKGGEGEIQVPLPATPGLTRIKEVVIFHERPVKGPINMVVRHLSVRPIGSKSIPAQP